MTILVTGGSGLVGARLLHLRGGGLNGVGQRGRGDDAFGAEAFFGQQRERVDVHRPR